MRQWAKNNGLALALFLLFFVSIIGHFISGGKAFNEELKDKGKPEISLSQYFTTGDFVESVFENWESEFLQMAVYVALTAFLFQKGSPESKKLDGPEEVDRPPDPRRKGAPWAVRKGGFVMALYSHSLTAVLFLLFVLSFVLHAVGGAKAENAERRDEHKPPVTVVQFAESPKFWFQSFQNWQSEFLSMGAIIVLSIVLRQRGSPESKPVDAPHSRTGE